MNIKVLVADDENLIRKLLVSSLSQFDDIEIVGQAGNGEEVMQILEMIHPDVLLLDLNMPRLSGIDVLRQAKAASIHVNTLVLSMQDDDSAIRDSIKAGALGFLYKSEDWDEMHTAIKTVAKGRLYNTDRINAILLEMLGNRNEEWLDPHKNISLNERELSIIRYLNEGLTSNQIAEKIYCSRATVDRTRQDLIHRLGVKNTAGLVSHSIKQRLLQLDN